MYRVRTARCRCCELDLDIRVDLADPFADPMCARCFMHADDEWIRLVDHVAMYRNAMRDARDATELAESERTFYRDRANDHAKNGESLVRILTEIDDLHHLRGTRCACGVAECRVMELLSDPGVARMIGTYDEQRHTLFELRRANPGAWSEEWDDIDVTLVYPPAQGRRGAAGRHRAIS